MTVLIIDNYDSFTFNLYQLIAMIAGSDVVVKRNDEISFSDIKNMRASQIVLSPGPGHPACDRDFGVCKTVVSCVSELNCPVLGVCLGHQGIVEHRGGRVVRAPQPMHGKTSAIDIVADSPLFMGIESGVKVMRYHSLTAQRSSLPKELEIVAEVAGQNEIVMAVQDRASRLYGLQFHPESVGTAIGKENLGEFYCIMLGLEAFDTILDPASNDERIIAAFACLQLSNTDLTMLTNAIEKIRNTADIHSDLLLELNELGHSVIDCSGTGGSGMAHFNTSTSTAFVLAAAGYKVAKFGSRAASGSSGSFDFLESLGINSTLPLQSCADALSACGVAFIFAPKVYPCLKRLAPLRKQFGKTTLLNYIGPLLNPLRPASRLMGVSADRARIILAEHLRIDKNTRRAILVTSGGRLDEFAPDTLNKVSMIDQDELHEFWVDAQNMPNLVQESNYACQGEDERNSDADISLAEKKRHLSPNENLHIFNEIIDGKDTSSTYYKMLLLNAAGGLFVLNACKSIGEGIGIAADLIAAGAVAENLASCRRFYEKFSC